MQQYLKNTAGQPVYVEIHNTSNVAVTAGAIFSVSKDGGAFVAAAGPAATHLADGVWVYKPSADETNATVVCIKATAASAVTRIVTFSTTKNRIDDLATEGVELTVPAGTYTTTDFRVVAPAGLDAGYLDEALIMPTTSGHSLVYPRVTNVAAVGGQSDTYDLTLDTPLLDTPTENDTYELLPRYLIG